MGTSEDVVGCVLPQHKVVILMDNLQLKKSILRSRRSSLHKL